MKLIFLVFLLTVTHACTPQMAYQSGQEWQKNECYKIASPSERERCLENINPAYETYQQQIKRPSDPKE
ncbi:hypothetical protein [Thiosulfativibrio zosterae]|uniref:Lipoprotein n=1 Tax=Thiosulfativibrio zosterae TaxID=2675053 RepID=A0A6F8PK12_9GAMM|nr:hypothetical protein [Thiosulfativibrio zosterae]BBP42340.1 hypothetical protein THMIRHAT_00860 [Thiosulfativibrio zosterae]